MRPFGRKRRKSPFMPSREVFYTGRCRECGAPTLSVPKYELHMPSCPKGTTATFTEKIEGKS